MNIKLAFTLAEVLIVLGIIGLIADMTIPTLVSSTQEKVTVVKLKKFHSTMESSFRLAVQENGTPENWDLKAKYDPDGATNILRILSRYLNTSKICGVDPDCVTENPDYKLLNGQSFTPFEASATAFLADGSLLMAWVADPNCERNNGDTKALQNICGGLYVDINGLKGPNVVGKDYHCFWLTKYGVIPLGSQQERDFTFENSCLGQKEGSPCTAWVIYNENMDYLHCDDLSWGGKSKCD